MKALAMKMRVKSEDISECSDVEEESERSDCKVEVFDQVKKVCVSDEEWEPEFLVEEEIVCLDD